MRIHISPRLVVIGLVAATATAIPSAASADTISFGDRADDIQPGIDIRNVRVRNERRVVVTVRHEDLRRSDLGNGLSIFLDTRAARSGPEFVFHAGVGEGTDWSISPARRWQAVRGPLSCSTDFSFNYATDVTRSSIARRCLDGAGRVRVSVRANTNSERDWAPGYHRFSDWVARG